MEVCVCVSSEGEHDAPETASERIPNTFKLLKTQLNTVQRRRVSGNFVLRSRAKVHVLAVRFVRAYINCYLFCCILYGMTKKN